jgi:hypothetical protein
MRGKRAQAVAFGYHAQRDLLGHRAARHKHGGIFAEQFCDARLERIEPRARAVEIDVRARLAERARRGVDRGRIGPAVAGDRIGAIEPVDRRRGFL